MIEDPDDAGIQADVSEPPHPGAAIRRLLELRAETARRYPEAPAIPWETLKTWMRDEDNALGEAPVRGRS
jgi:hypothetical protein